MMADVSQKFDCDHPKSYTATITSHRSSNGNNSSSTSPKSTKGGIPVPTKMKSQPSREITSAGGSSNTTAVSTRRRNTSSQQQNCSGIPTTTQQQQGQISSATTVAQQQTNQGLICLGKYTPPWNTAAELAAFVRRMGPANITIASTNLLQAASFSTVLSQMSDDFHNPPQLDFYSTQQHIVPPEQSSAVHLTGVLVPSRPQEQSLEGKNGEKTDSSVPTQQRGERPNDNLSCTTSGAGSRNRCKVLSLESDKQELSPYQCIVREQIEVFEQAKDEKRGSTQGRNRPVEPGQVGIRCRHCGTRPASSRTRAAVLFPSTLLGVYQTAQNMANTHFVKTCKMIPEDTRQALIDVRSRKEGKKTCKSSYGAGREYWANTLRVLGVVETSDQRLRFGESFGLGSAKVTVKEEMSTDEPSEGNV